ncbi:porin family protein [Xanthovirga aplysinae]|uniref:porin family protein n=1 Tax=Xanthovirga aplysinae TaxID=2529853 RepID=UPI0012BC2157|nr:porin family protein [Xanthovirga aplysinae]MTI31015.1 PorT family protein [Xanthovirga aplysinae]
MKKTFLSIVGLMLVVMSTQAQSFKFGPKVGVISSNTSLRENINGIQEGTAKFGVQAGAFARVSLGGLFIQPESLFTSNRSDLSIGTSQPTDVTFNRTRLDVPVMVGLKFLNLVRVQAGPVANFVLSSKAKGNEANVDRDNNTAIGYQAGVGVDLWKFTFDLRYEGNLSSFGETVSIANQEFTTDYRTRQLLFQLGFNIF